MDPCLSCKLPKQRSSAGQILQHGIKVVNRLLGLYQPMTYKFGITHCASFRWHNPKFGYKFSKDSFARLLVLFASADPIGPAFLEAGLINQFKGFRAAIHSSSAIGKKKGLLWVSNRFSVHACFCDIYSCTCAGIYVLSLGVLVGFA